MEKKEKRFTVSDYFIRLGLALVLVLATYNPTSYSFIDWIVDAIGEGEVGALHFFVGVVLIVGWFMLVRATMNSLGVVGLALGAALIGTLVWLLYDVGLLTGSSLSFFSWIALIGISVLLAVGLCWAHLWRALTGQYSVEDIDD